MSKQKNEKKTTKAGTAVNIKALREAISEDLNLLAFFHAEELDAATLKSLQSSPFAHHIGIVLSGKRATEALLVLDSGLSGADDPDQNQAHLLDELACDYAGIYLTHQCGVSPCESPWRDEDRLERQQPMFEVRKWYNKYGRAAYDWRKRPDDHLGTQLAFAAHLIGDQDIDLVETAHFLDQHLFHWIGPFCERVAGRCATPFYAGLSMLTFAYLEQVRDMIEALTGLKRPPSEKDEKEKEKAQRKEEFDTAFVPGTDGPGW